MVVLAGNGSTLAGKENRWQSNPDSGPKPALLFAPLDEDT